MGIFCPARRSFPYRFLYVSESDLGTCSRSTLVRAGFLAAHHVLVSFWRGLPYNRRPDEAQLLPNLGPGNVVTLARGLLTAALVGFIVSPQPQGWLAWMPGVLYTLVCIADFLDGYLARVTDQVTGLGERLDLSLDGLGVLIASVLVVQYGQAPRWFVLVGLARYLFLAGIWIRKQLGMAVFDLPPSNFRRGIAGLMMDFMAVLLFPIFSPPSLPGRSFPVCHPIFCPVLTRLAVCQWGHFSPESQAPPGLA